MIDEPPEGFDGKEREATEQPHSLLHRHHLLTRTPVQKLKMQPQAFKIQDSIEEIKSCLRKKLELTETLHLIISSFVDMHAMECQGTWNMSGGLWPG